jgi:hypothetical protein
MWFGGVPERSNGAVLKTAGGRKVARGFKSHPRRFSSRIPLVTNGWSDCGRSSALDNEEREYLDARLLAAPADLRADAAMLVVGRVPVTLLRTDAARLEAGLDD